MMTPIVEIRDVTFAYKDDVEVLHQVNLSIEPGQTLALVGPTGAGKTTIINLINAVNTIKNGNTAKVTL